MAYKHRPLFWGSGTFLTKVMFKKQRENQRLLSNHPHTSHKSFQESKQMTEKSTFWQSNLTDQFRNTEIHTWLRQAWRNKQKWNEEMYKWSPKPRVISFSPRLEL